MKVFEFTSLSDESWQFTDFKLYPGCCASIVSIIGYDCRNT